MSTLVLYVGSPWADDRNTIAKLLHMLASETLDPAFERYGGFASKAERAVVRSYNLDIRTSSPLSEVSSVHFHGNFYSYSCAFSVYTDDPDVIQLLSDAIKSNQATLAYKEARDARKKEEIDRETRERDLIERQRQRRS